MKLFYDLHIHSCLSPCATADMTPANIAGTAAVVGLDLFAIADHNSTGNCRPALSVAEKLGVLALPAMELCTAEEVHILCLFGRLEDAERFGAFVYERLPDIRNRPEVFGEQHYMDDDETVIGEEPRLLLTAADIGVYDAAGLARDFGGLAVPAHAGRPSFSLLSNMGCWDAAMGFGGVEHTAGMEGLCPAFSALPCLVNSDAHQLPVIADPVHFIEAEDRSAEAAFDALKRRLQGPLR